MSACGNKSATTTKGAYPATCGGKAGEAHGSGTCHGDVAPFIKVAFVCLGNICRSPMAELIFKDMIEKAGVADMFFVDSFGTSDEEEGNPVYPLAMRTLSAHGIRGEHTAKKMTCADVERFDYVLVMEEKNRSRLVLTTNGRYYNKMKRLCDYTDRPRDVVDPWYTRDFEKAYADIYDGCASFLKHILDNNR